MMNKTLLQILLDELPRRDGWPDGAVCVIQSSNGKIGFSRAQDVYHNGMGWISFDSMRHGWMDNYSFQNDLATDHATATVTKEQYEAALKENTND